MNYFEFYDIPVSLTIDATHLKKIYIEKSKLYHPDFHTMHSEAEQSDNLDLSTLNNQAFKTLSKENLLIPYVFSIFDIDYGSGKDDFPQDFLIEMMDINEKLMDLEMDEDTAQIEELKKEVLQIKSSLSEQLDSKKSKFDHAEDKKSLLEEIKELFLKAKYVQRIEDRLAKNMNFL